VKISTENGPDGAALLPDIAAVAMILDAIPHPVFIKDEGTRFVAVNAMMCDIMGRAPDEMLGNTDADLVPREQAEIYRGNDLRVLASGEVNENEELLTDSTGRQLTVVTRKKRIKLPSGDFLLVGCITDISNFRSAEAVIRHQAEHDALTGLVNRRVFFDAVGRLLPFRSPRGFAVLMMDLDRFKPVNDLYGHLAGDALLCQVADRLLECVRDEDVVARLGGDEFGVIIRVAGDRETRLRVATATAQRMVEAVNTSASIGAVQVRIGASIGIAICDDLSDATPETLVRAADVAMYAAKDSGRGTVKVFEPGMDEKARRTAALTARLPIAIAGGEIVPHFQPLVDLADNRMIGFEVLARWMHSDLGEIEPSEFIPLAERSGAIGDLTFALLRQACAATKDWPEPYFLSLNVSPGQLSVTTLPGAIERVLQEFEFPAERLEIEITENAIVADLENAKAAFSALRKLGVRLALDDFGTGYSGLHHLRELQFDKIKIDRSFITSMLQSAESARIVNAILALTQSLGLPTIAEGLEDADLVRTLRERGCEFGQGYYFGKPMPAAALQDFLAGRGDPERQPD